jgi:hypothetical protein
MLLIEIVKDNFEQVMINEGIIMRKYKDSLAEEYIKMEFETIFEGYKIASGFQCKELLLKKNYNS